MHRTLTRLAALLSLALCSAVHAQAPVAASALRPVDKPNALTASIDALIAQPRFAGAQWGVAVVSLDDGRTVYAHRAEHLLQPASTAKLFTAALTLDALGADQHATTRLLAKGPVHRRRLDGPLVLYGMGDPALGTDGTSADWADQLAAQLAANGITRIHGDLIADDSYFAGPLIGSGWEVGDLLSAFAVPASALSVRENAGWLTVSPAAHAGGAADLALDPPLAIPGLTSRIVTTAAGSRSDINLYRAPGGDTLYAFGSVAADTSPRRFHLAMADPARVAAEALREAFARHDVLLDGRVRTLHWPDDDSTLIAGATLVGEIDSPPLGEILRRGLKRSQNLYLQNLLLMAGVQAQTIAMQGASPPQGFITTEAWGLRALRKLLDRIGIAPTQARLEEGSGLSRQNLVTPAAMVRLLQYLAVQPYASLLRDALPLAGVDGSLASRFRGTPLAGRLQAKTGSMTFVNCLAGYLTTDSGEHLAFAIMLNNYEPQAGAPSASRDVDAIAALLAGTPPAP
ncbi:D-alanyl-D-alanine carboxypeptidase/D-alanyl-D-alanine endopeptidase [Dyella sp.]|jgi:D-alanyl-D-alanine carboxypeptidase/D-alanyl-D-alanine-endopeptidase (penicillin-binding protein 4)|uniref:D-alanyl-D-alanine carboxypeptidase/D-alanyl-D-alanine endopeptidase n=1 Tax=Dyella sp. TaxID=1869338 RepID=UPI002D765B93|nr:D-alanyl-D-alanine carboxypeptidase/D-alanyl-D-alanine-endopeptidase [Dyella sp.]HET6430963.1 D-alanyl-D-alanine carboxypeptidase/D-alanyl-D-alanine-endopeptidase [Dyella sp.]